MVNFFEDTIRIMEDSLQSINVEIFYKLVEQAMETLKANRKIVVSGLGKNVPICDKFVGSMLSLGLDANFLHTNSAIHGDLGMVHNGDLVIILTKSGTTKESIYLVELLQQRKNVKLWLLTFQEESILTKMIGKEHSIIMQLQHEGDIWNIMPNNSTTLNLIVLQVLVMELAKKMNLSLKDFKQNHPGGAIGEKLKNA